MRHCYISRNYKNLASAGGKAKSDIEEIMKRRGFCNLGLKQTSHKNKAVDFVLTFTGVALAAMRLRKGDILVLQYPMKKYYETVCNIAHRKGAKVITQIHDLGSFRSKKLTVKQEIDRLNHSDAIIAHNETMRKWLLDNGCAAKVVCLGIFDYLSPHPITSERPAPCEGVPFSIFFIGNLNPKSNPFVYELPRVLKRNPVVLYGNKYRPELMDEGSTAVYEGYGKDYRLMQNNKGDFGLSWYGESLDEGIGKIGEYMAYNNPHKVSLYIRCHTPVIISRNAGLASFVEENGIGICVDSLRDLDGILNSMTVEDYERMKANVISVSDKIASGHYFSAAFDKAVQALGIEE